MGRNRGVCFCLCKQHSSPLSRSLLPTLSISSQWLSPNGLGVDVHQSTISSSLGVADHDCRVACWPGVDEVLVSSLSFGHAPTCLPHLSCLTFLGTRDRHPPAKVTCPCQASTREAAGARPWNTGGSLPAHLQVPCVPTCTYPGTAAWPMWFEELRTMRWEIAPDPLPYRSLSNPTRPPWPWWLSVGWLR
ncbi:hypothetical protein BN1708_014204 [Verticillium longisporum]|uniref:Uncharacterized protein n=1 Tax=Verticillium longisporum TaxID=100787 RepID=A0A0G4LTH7_VERLO|nr:hypothetical protein BN1708_014204 [Verticillium longisporum]